MSHIPTSRHSAEQRDEKEPKGSAKPVKPLELDRFYHERLSNQLAGNPNRIG